MMRRRYNFEFATSPKDVGMATGATIHTANGLRMKVTRRQVASQQRQTHQLQQQPADSRELSGVAA